MSDISGGSGLLFKNNPLITTPARRSFAAAVLCLLVALTARAAFAQATPDPVAAMVEKVSPAVVRIITVRPVTPEPASSGPKATAADNAESIATGSGFIIDPAGYISTNKHVVDGAISVIVVTADGEHHRATVAGVPAEVDMALLKIDTGHAMPFVRFGDSDKMRPGDRVVAIGSPFGLDTSVSTRIVSAVNRDIMESPFDDYIQTDAAINHGNSGGPLFNLSGEVIGMTSVIYAPGRGSVGVGFALPSNGMNFVYDRLMKTGELKAGMLPLHTQPVTWMLQQGLDTPDLTGALVTSVEDDGDKMLLGKIRPGDVIRTFNGQPVSDPRDLARMAARSPIGSNATFRGGDFATVHVTVQAWPEAKPIVLDYDRRRTLGLELAAGKGDNNEPIVTVAAVDPQGTAAASGIQKGDRIVEIQQTPISDPNQALRIFRVRSSDRHSFSALLVERDKKTFWMSLNVAIPE